MAIIDSDAHVVETDRTWEYMAEEDQRFRPVRVAQVSPEGSNAEYWVIDGHMLRVRQRGGALLGDRVDVPESSEYMLDVDLRLQHMDQLGTDIQILYPTMFILPYTMRPDMELALVRSYNRWLADIWQRGKGRLRWAALLPLLSMDKSIEEARIAKEQGACAVMFRGIECGNKLLSDPYFYPIYEELSRLDLPVCVHTGNGSDALMDLYNNETGFSRFKLVGVGAFHNLLMNGIPDKFPGLRFGFIELSSQWLPYVVHDLNRRLERQGRPMKEDVLKDNHVWIACQTDDDLPEVLRYAGEDNLVIGTDYGHADTSTEVYALQTLKKESPIDAATINKILDDNARALYSL